MQALTAEITKADKRLRPIVARTAPRLSALSGVGADVAGQLLATAGDNPDRLRSEAALAHLCGAAPIPASSGRTDRHRLNRGGDRAANRALYTIALCRMRYDPATQAYVGTTHQTRPEQERDHALPQALHHPRSSHRAPRRFHRTQQHLST